MTSRRGLNVRGRDPAQEVLRQDGDQGVSRKSQMPGRGGLRNLACYSSSAEEQSVLKSSRPRRLVRHLCQDVRGELRWASAGVVTPPR